jgi:4-amino-4-deoxy-L-arabinose transferase-like glycosyltransferase
LPFFQHPPMPVHQPVRWLSHLLQDRRVLAALALGMLVHMGLALTFHLSVDEAHYALYASKLDWSYFDHPPLVGWVQWPAWQLGGSDILMRVSPMVCWLLTVLGVMYLSDTLYPGAMVQRVAGLRADLWLLLLSPLPHLLGVALVPDSLLMPLTCATMALSWQLCQPAQLANQRLWLLLGLCLGLSGLTKYTAVMIAVGVVIVLLRAHGMAVFAKSGLWIAVAVAALCVMPVFYWNAQHDWVSLAYQLGHAKGAGQWKLQNILVFIVLIWLAHGLLLPAGLWARARASSNPAWGFCASFGLPSLLLLCYLSARGSALPHWATPAWVALIPPAAVGVLALWQRYRRWVLATAALQALMCTAFLALMATAGIGQETGSQATSLPGAMSVVQRNPFADLYGWDRAAVRAKALAQRENIPTLAVINWSLASRLAWYAQPMPVKVVERHFDQFDMWFGPLQTHESVLLVDWSLMSYAPPVGPAQFERCEQLEQIPITHLGRQISHFNISKCYNWQSISVQ